MLARKRNKDWDADDADFFESKFEFVKFVLKNKMKSPLGKLARGLFLCTTLSFVKVKRLQN